MPRRIPTVALGGILALVVGSVVVAQHPWRRAMPSVVVADVPAPARAAAAAALAQAGWREVSEPVWAGEEGVWRAPGTCRLFFAALASVDGNHDVYSAEVQVDADGRLGRLGKAAALLETPAGDEGAPVACGGWLAFPTCVGGRVQSITCVRISDPSHPQVYALERPADSIVLAWRDAAGRAWLDMAVTWGEQRDLVSVDPEARRVAPGEADLRYVPAARGEQAWLPNLVSRVRELPGVGPEKIAFLENVFFVVTDWLTRLAHGRAVTPVTPEPELMRSPSAAAPPLPVAAEGEPTTPAGPAVQATPSPMPTPEGRLLADGIVWRGSVKPDAARPYAAVEVIDIDPALLQLKMVPGTWEPRPTTGLVGSGVIPNEDWPALVAAFNGGFAAMHGQYGMMVDRKVYLPARDGVATVAVYEDGTIRMGTWGRDLVQTPDMVSYRQNCPPLIENGAITAETGKLTLWGLSVSDEVYLYRSGLGVTKDGHLLYVCGRSLSAYTLARALQMAGAWYAMQLDVDEFHVAFITYEVQPAQAGGPPAVTGRKLLADMRGFDTFFLKPFQLDFFYLVRRPQPRAQAVRWAPAAQGSAETPVELAQPLPGKIAFAANQDGNWDVYTLIPGRPQSVQRLTNDPADDLYPAWSRDGRRLAFTSRRDGNSEIYVMDPQDGAVRRVTAAPSEEWAPCWAPDGLRIAYQSDRNGQSDIYVAAVDGSGETRLTPMVGNHEAPDWSPDGQTLAFDSDQETAGEVSASISLYLMDADGSNHRRVASYAESPRWSPDGKAIAFTSRRAGYWQVYVMNADGSGLRQVTDGAWDHRYPAWSPDGRWLAFAANRQGRWQLYASAIDGGETLCLTSGPGDSSFPSWGP